MTEPKSRSQAKEDVEEGAVRGQGIASFSMAYALSLVRKRQEEKEQQKLEDDRARDEEMKEKARAKRRRRRQNQKLAKLNKLAADNNSDNKHQGDQEQTESSPLDEPRESLKRKLEHSDSDQEESSPEIQKTRPKKRRKKPKSKTNGETITDTQEAFSGGPTYERQTSEIKVNTFVPRAVMLKQAKR